MSSGGLGFGKFFFCIILLIIVGVFLSRLYIKVFLNLTIKNITVELLIASSYRLGSIKAVEANALIYIDYITRAYRFLTASYLIRFLCLLCINIFMLLSKHLKPSKVALLQNARQRDKTLYCS